MLLQSMKLIRITNRLTDEMTVAQNTNGTEFDITIKDPNGDTIDTVATGDLTNA